MLAVSIPVSDVGTRSLFSLARSESSKLKLEIILKIEKHSESHIVELADGSRWSILPGDMDFAFVWLPETDLAGLQNR